MLESRNQIGQGKSAQATQQLLEIKKSIKDLKVFMTQSTRQQHQAQQVRQKQQSDLNLKASENIKKLQSDKEKLESDIERIRIQYQQLKNKSATKTQISDVNFEMSAQNNKFIELKEGFENIEKILLNSKVQEFKQTIDNIAQQTTTQIKEMKLKLSLKSDTSDLLKLQEMLLNMMQYSHQNNVKSYANKSETKKALIFLQKRMNSMLITLMGDDQNQRQALITSKNIKCISCTKDLGQMQGKLDKYKSWNVFPVKQPNTKDKYSGFGSGFQSIVQTTINKKGGQIIHDDKGRMTAPFNLTSTVQASHFKGSKSQHKLGAGQSSLKNVTSKIGFSPSPSKSSLKYQTNFMFQFGGGVRQQDKFDIRQEYLDTERGLINVMGYKGALALPKK